MTATLIPKLLDITPKLLDVTPKLLDMDQVRIDPAWALRVPASLALRRLVLPIACVENEVFVACGDNTDITALQAVERFVGMPVQARQADIPALKRALQRVFGNSQGARGSDGSPIIARGGDPRLAGDSEPDAVALCDELLYAAVVREASDIHLDPCEEGATVRFRVDGVLERYRPLGPAILTGIIKR